MKKRGKKNKRKRRGVARERNPRTATCHSILSRASTNHIAVFSQVWGCREDGGEGGVVAACCYCCCYAPLAATAVAVRFDEKKTALSRGWCTPLARGSAVCEQNAPHNIHANPGLFFSPIIRLAKFN